MDPCIPVARVHCLYTNLPFGQLLPSKSCRAIQVVQGFGYPTLKIAGCGCTLIFGVSNTIML